MTDQAAARVSVDNFARAETARMFDGTLAQSGGVNRWVHLRAPVPLDRQSVIRMNRDTLYSGAIVDIAEGAEITVPDAGDRYVSVMVVNEDHYVNEVLREPGRHELTTAVHGSEFVSLSIRVFVDPDDPGDVAAVNALQDQFAIEAASARPYTHADYDTESFDTTRAALLTLAGGLPDARAMFGARGDVDPVRHLIGTAFGWGGLPESEAFYTTETTPKPAGHYRITFRDVPVDGFWSISVYNADGFFEANEFASYSMNSVTAVPGADGGVTIDLSPTAVDAANHLYVMEGWNYAIRLYRPRPEIIDGRWVAPTPVLVG